MAKNKHVEKFLSDKAAQAHEDKARWAKDFPGREPGTSTKSWKSYTRIRQASEAFRNGYDSVRWDDR